MLFGSLVLRFAVVIAFDFGFAVGSLLLLGFVVCCGAVGLGLLLECLRIMLTLGG